MDPREHVAVGFGVVGQSGPAAIGVCAETGTRLGEHRAVHEEKRLQRDGQAVQIQNQAGFHLLSRS